MGDDRSINLGAEFQWGEGSDVIVEDVYELAEDPTFFRVDREQYMLLFFLSGAFDFAQKSAADVFMGDEEKEEEDQKEDETEQKEETSEDEVPPKEEAPARAPPARRW